MPGVATRFGAPGKRWLPGQVGGVPAASAPIGTGPVAGPTDAIGLTVELFLGSAWVDISPFVFYQSKIRIVRGKPNETSRIQPQTCTFVINNRDGRFSPRNPLGPYYGLIGRNTPVRVSRMQNGIRRFRFYGEVPSWPATWDITGTDVRVTISAAGQMRRLFQGALPLKSTFYRVYGQGTVAVTPPVAYWPAEDGRNSTVIASGLPGGTAMSLSGQALPTFASNTAFVCSAALPLLAGSIWTGSIPQVATSANTLRFLMSIPATGAYDGGTVAQLFTAGTVARVDVIWLAASGGTMQINGYDIGGNSLFTSGSMIGNVTGKSILVSLELTQSGNNVQTLLYYAEQPYVIGIFGEYFELGGATVSGTIGQATQVVINAFGHLNDTAIGHVIVQAANDGLAAVLDPFNGYLTEWPTNRFKRLCTEQGVAAVTIGVPDAATMGFQTIDTFPTLVQQPADTNAGLLFEARDQAALVLRTRATLYNQAAKLTLDHSQHQLSGPLNPVDDDALTRNDVTVTRINASSAQVQQTTGTLSVQPPPNGVGDYSTNYSISLSADSQLSIEAGWRLHLGTVDQPRFPNVPINLRHPTFTSNVDMMNAALTIDIGDRLVITNPPPWMPPDPISQIVQGYTEILGIWEHDMVLNCSPEDPYKVGLLDDAVLGHLDTDGSTLTLPAGSADVTLTVSTTNSASPVWTTNPADFPFDIAVGGERMTVTNITGTGTTSVALGVDGTFESGVAGWTVGTGSTLAASGAAAHSGSFSGLVAGPGTTLIQITTPYIAVTPLFVYTASVWLLLQAGTIDQAAVRIMWFDSTHSFISQIDSPIVTASGGWANLAVAQAAPSGAVFAQTQFHAHTPGTDSAFIDDFTLTTPSPQQFTVTRSVNGIVKAQTAGTDVRLWQPLYLSV